MNNHYLDFMNPHEKEEAYFILYEDAFWDKDSNLKVLVTEICDREMHLKNYTLDGADVIFAIQESTGFYIEEREMYTPVVRCIDYTIQFKIFSKWHTCYLDKLIES